MFIWAFRVRDCSIWCWYRMTTIYTKGLTRINYYEKPSNFAKCFLKEYFLNPEGCFFMKFFKNMNFICTKLKISHHIRGNSWVSFIQDNFLFMFIFIFWIMCKTCIRHKGIRRWTPNDCHCLLSIFLFKSWLFLTSRIFIMVNVIQYLKKYFLKSFDLHL